MPDRWRDSEVSQDSGSRATSKKRCNAEINIRRPSIQVAWMGGWCRVGTGSPEISGVPSAGTNERDGKPPDYHIAPDVQKSHRLWDLERTLIRRCSDDHDPDVEQGAENFLVKEMTTRVTEVLTDHVYRDSPEARRRRAIWSMMGKLSMKERKGHFSRLSNLCRWLLQRPIIDAPVCRRYLFNHCLSGIATNVASRDISRFAHKISEVVMISVWRPLHAGGALRSPLGAIDRLRLRRIARRYASDRSVGSSWSLDWTSMTKAELTAENRPACECGQHIINRSTQRCTYEYQGGVEILVVFLHVFGIVLHRLSFVHGIEVKLGVVVLDWLQVHP